MNHIKARVLNINLRLFYDLRFWFRLFILSSCMHRSIGSGQWSVNRLSDNKVQIAHAWNQLLFFQVSTEWVCMQTTFSFWFIEWAALKGDIYYLRNEENSLLLLLFFYLNSLSCLEADQINSQVWVSSERIWFQWNSSDFFFWSTKEFWSLSNFFCGRFRCTRFAVFTLFKWVG